MYTKLSISGEHVMRSHIGRRVKDLCNTHINARHDRVNVGSGVIAFNALDGGVELQFAHALIELPFDLEADDVVQVHIVYNTDEKVLDPGSTGTYWRGLTWSEVIVYDDGSGIIHAFAASLGEANKLVQDVRDRCSVRLGGLERV